MAVPGTFQTIYNNVIAVARLDATADLASVKDWINLAYAEAVIETEYLISTGTYTLTANLGTYDLTTVASGAVRFKSLWVTSGGVPYGPLMQVTLDKILEYRKSAGGSATATGTSTFYAVEGYKILELYPTPQAADTLTCYYVAEPTALSANGDIPILPEPYGTRCLQYGALAQAADFMGDPQGAYWQQQSDFWKTRLRAHLNRRKGGAPGQLEWVPAASIRPHDPATILPG